MNDISTKVFVRMLAAACCAALAISAQAAGLGGITVQSALGQPLSAEIEILALQSGEFADISARIATEQAYRTANLPYLYVFRQVAVTTDRRADGTPVLKLSSHTSINEPSIELLVEFNWRSGKLLQKYSVLLDPAK